MKIDAEDSNGESRLWHSNLHKVISPDQCPPVALTPFRLRPGSDHQRGRSPYNRHESASRGSPPIRSPLSWARWGTSGCVNGTHCRGIFIFSVVPRARGLSVVGVDCGNRTSSTLMVRLCHIHSEGDRFNCLAFPTRFPPDADFLRHLVPRKCADNRMIALARALSSPIDRFFATS